MAHEEYEFAKIPDGFAVIGKRPQDKIVDRIEPGIYVAHEVNDNNFVFTKIKTNSETIVAVPDPAIDLIMADVTAFLDGKTKAIYQEYGFMYKRGILMHSVPGTGKTTLARRISNMCVEKNMIVLFDVAPDTVHEVLPIISKRQPDARFLVIWEELDHKVKGSPYEIQQLLDGIVSVDNVIYLATTNKLEDIPESIRCRPSRFARVVEVGCPSEEARRVYLEARIKPQHRETVNIERMVAATDGMVLDSLKDVAVSVLCFGKTIEEAVELITKERNSKIAGFASRTEKKVMAAFG